jgi:serpin B
MTKKAIPWPTTWVVLSLALAMLVSSCTPQLAPIPPYNSPQPTPSAPPVSLPTLPPSQSGGQYVQSNLVRVASPNIAAGDLSELVQGNSAFAMALYQQLARGDGNLFFSPYSISLALAMTYAGARGDTEAQMAQTLDFTLPQERLHPAMNSLDQTITSYAPQNAASDQGFQLNIANSIWGQQGFTFLPAYLDLLAQNYGAGMHLLDFLSAPEPSRKVINDWVTGQTRGKITNLFPQGSINDTTRLVLANAIYFKAAWQNAFDTNSTHNAPFYLTDGTTTSTLMMSTSGETSFPYLQGEGYQAISLGYQDSPVRMIIVMPSAGNFSEFESGLTEAQLEAILAGLQDRPVTVTMPKFKVESTIDLKNVLTALGMKDAFDENADFSGMDGKKDLFISDVLHKAYVNVDERGTEAAAATGVVVGIMAIPAQPLRMTVDHPFIFFLVDSQTKTILFMGRVMNPGT